MILLLHLLEYAYSVVPVHLILSLTAHLVVLIFCDGHHSVFVPRRGLRYGSAECELVNKPFSLRLPGYLPLLILLLHHVLIKRAHLGIRLSRGPSRVQGWLSLLAIGGTPSEVLGITQRVVRLAVN